MRNVVVQNVAKVRRAVPRIENSVKVRIGVGSKGKGSGSFFSVKGSELNEFLVERIIEAVDFGFCIEDALLLLKDGFALEFIDVKEHTHRKNLKDVRARIIGTDGKARKTIEKLTGAEIVISGNRIGVIVDSEHLVAVTQAIGSLIGGSKHGNVFGGLERAGVRARESLDEDLGLKDGVEL